MAERIGAQVEIEYKSVGEMRKAIKEATGDVIRLQQQFGATSKEAIEAAKRAADLKDRVKEAAEVTDLFDPGNKFKALGNTVQLAANGFTALQGAIGLFGVKSEEVEKQLLKVQSALALSQGLSALADGAKEFERLKVVAVNALSAIKKGIGATGIGLLVVAVGSLVAYWDDIKEAIFGVSEAQKDLNEQSQANLEVQQEKLKAIDAQDNVLKLQGKSEKQILQIKQAQTKEAIAAAEINLANAVQTQKIQAETAKRNRDILAGVIDFITKPVQLLFRTAGKIASFFGKNIDIDKAIEFATLETANLIFNPDETAAEGQKTIDEAQRVLDELKNRYAGYQLQIMDIDKKAGEQNKNVKNEKIRTLQELNNAVLNEAVEADAMLFETLQKQQQEQDKIDKERRDAIEKEKEDAAERERQRFDRNLQLQLQYNQAVLAAETDLQNAKFQAVSSGIDLLGTLVGKNRALSNTLFAIDKALAIGKVVVDTQKEIAGYYANPTWKLLPDGGIALATAASLKAKIRAGISIASIAATSIQKFLGGASASSAGIPNVTTAAPVTAQLSPTVQAQAVNANAINNLGNQALRAYVVNSDIQNQNQLNALLQRNASVG